jgi:hypothetical protein
MMPAEDACIGQDYKRMRSGVSSSKHAAVYLWFIEFCENEEYADQFLAGDLYLNPLAYFRNIESTGDQGRNDSTEAIAMWWQPKDISMLLDIPGIGRTEITAKDLAAPVSMSFNYHDSLKYPFSLHHLREWVRIQGWQVRMRRGGCGGTATAASNRSSVLQLGKVRERDSGGALHQAAA